MLDQSLSNMDLILEFGFTHLENLLPFLFSFLMRLSYSSEVATYVSEEEGLGRGGGR